MKQIKDLLLDTVAYCLLLPNFFLMCLALFFMWIPEKTTPKWALVRIEKRFENKRKFRMNNKGQSLVSVMISIGILSIVMLGSLQVLSNSIKMNTTSQVLTDINTYVNNARVNTPTLGCSNISGFCYEQDVVENGNTFMVFTITKQVFGPSVIKRLKPMVAISGGGSLGSGLDNGNHSGELK